LKISQTLGVVYVATQLALLLQCCKCSTLLMLVARCHWMGQSTGG